MTATLQAAGVPAGFMQRAAEYEDDPQLQARDFLRTFEQPGLEPMAIEHAPFRSELIPAPANMPAPEPGEHTREICTGLLGMDPDDVDRLVASGVLEEPVAEPRTRGSPRCPGDLPQSAINAMACSGQVPAASSAASSRSAETSIVSSRIVT